jgi:hypothetical protein
VTAPEFEFGVVWVRRDGVEHVAVGYTRAGAPRMIAEAGGSGNEPRAVRVVRRSVGQWEQLTEETP